MPSRQVQEGILLPDRPECHQHGDDVAHDGGDTGAINLQAGEEPDAVDEEVVEHQVDAVGGQVGGHRDAGIAHAPLGSIDGQTHIAEKGTDHQQPEIAGCSVHDLRLGASKDHQRAGTGQSQY